MSALVKPKTPETDRQVMTTTDAFRGDIEVVPVEVARSLEHRLQLALREVEFYKARSVRLAQEIAA